MLGINGLATSFEGHSLSKWSEAIFRQRRFFVQEHAQPILGEGENFGIEKCSLGVYVGFERFVGIARSVFAIESAAQVQVRFVFGEKLLNDVVLPQNAK